MMTDTLSLFHCVAVFLILSVCLHAAQSAKLEMAFVAKDDTGKFSIKTGGQPANWVAKAQFDNKVNETGMFYPCVLYTMAFYTRKQTVITNDEQTDEDQAYAAGVVEGYITKDLITMHWKNTVEGQFCTRPLNQQCRQLQNFLQDNLSWMKQQIQQNPNDPYWRMVQLYLVQTVGLTDGYFNKLTGVSTDIDPFGLYVLSLSGDMEDIPNALNPYSKLKTKGSGSCSALIKVLPGIKELYVSHDTWDTYQSMLRVLKKYDFGFKVTPTGSEVPGKVITMSSYPGVLLSGDDFYLSSAALTTLETTIGNSNPALYKFVTHDTVLEAIRTMVANRLASSGKQWATLFSQHNSGTYNNQWMVVDYKLFIPGFTPPNGLLTILEQIPGTVKFEDKTEHLITETYWPSYNIPYFPEIFNKSGCWDNVGKFGDWFTYDKSPRAQIFQRDQDNVVDLASMQKLMRYNDFQHDPLSKCNCTPPYSAENGISARCDLNPANGTYPFGALGHRSHGGTDMKLTSFEMSRNLEFIAISGPTYDQLPAFQWSKADFADACPHHGHPDVYKFEPVKFNGTFTESTYATQHVDVSVSMN